jgi:hypothetical protein
MKLSEIIKSAIDAQAFRCARVHAARVFVVDFAGTWSAAGAAHIVDAGDFSV